MAGFFNNKGESVAVVNITPILTTGTKIATINGTPIFAPKTNSGSSTVGGIINKQNSMLRRFDITDGQIIELDEVGVKNGKCITFAGQINTFSNLIIGQGKNLSYGGSWIEIDNESIKISVYDGKMETNTISHGLTVTNNIQISIVSGKERKAEIKICSNGSVFEQQVDFLGDRGTPFVESVGSTLTNCSLGYSCHNLDNGIWLFGDSYFNLTAPNRWTSYLNIDDVLLDGHPGGKTAKSSLLEFDNLIKMGTPRMVIWCVGMNDYDGSVPTTTTVNSTWKNGVNHVMEVCENLGIELVLATIPTVYGGLSADSGISSFRSNKPKNDWIRDSGYRYIDFAQAVGADDSTGLWYNNGLENDMLENTASGTRVHPTMYGAKALYMQAIADVPELLTSTR